MKLPRFECVRPQSLGEVCKIAREEGPKAQIIAGGTDILPELKYKLKFPGMLIDISALSDLDRITYSEREGLTVGALVTLRRLAAHKDVREGYPLLMQAALSVGSAQLQAMGTIGGNLCQNTRCIYYNLPSLSRQGLDPCFKLGGGRCHAVQGSKICHATYSGDMAPALLALRACVTIADGTGENTIPLNELYSGRGEAPHVLEPGRILKGIHVPPPFHNVGVYVKMRIRKSIDYPLLGVAVNLLPNGKDGALKDILVGLTGVEKSPLLITPPDEIKDTHELEKQTEIMAEAAYRKAHPIANTSGYSPRYRREMVSVYVRQGVLQALEIAAGRG